MPLRLWICARNGTERRHASSAIWVLSVFFSATFFFKFEGIFYQIVPQLCFVAQTYCIMA